MTAYFSEIYERRATLRPQALSEMLRAAVALAAFASASAFAPMGMPAGLQLRANNVARAPRSAGEVFWKEKMPLLDDCWDCYCSRSGDRRPRGASAPVQCWRFVKIQPVQKNSATLLPAQDMQTMDGVYLHVQTRDLC